MHGPCLDSSVGDKLPTYCQRNTRFFVELLRLSARRAFHESPLERLTQEEHDVESGFDG